ncbi:T9SS type A sorting domain-containing protein [Candidatus Poribacteria bacterium]|nr:T9SS type A sorting domain-containing protein [Candidatus Poribacteria bacterium]
MWNTKTGENIKTLKGHTASVVSIAFSPNGQTLASGSKDSTIRLWNITTGRLIGRLANVHPWVNSVSFSPDGQTLASGSTDDTIRLWNTKTGEHIKTLKGHTDWFNTGGVRSVAFSPDGQTLASASSDGTINLWNTTIGKHITTLTGHTEAVRSIAFSPDGQTLASASWDRTIQLWEIPDTRTYISVETPPAPIKGNELTLSINITKGKNITGYQATINFDPTSLRYVSSTKGNYLPENHFSVDPVVTGNQVLLGGSSIDNNSSGNGTLATIKFEFIAIKESTLTLSNSRLIDSTGKDLNHLHQVSSRDVGAPQLQEDVNRDGVVDILDLTQVANSFGKDAERCVSGVYGDVNNDGNVDIQDLILMFALHLDYHTYSDVFHYKERDVVGDLIENAFDVDGTCSSVIKDSADVNDDGTIDIVDLVLVAGALGNKAAAPAAWAHHEHTLKKSDIQQVLAQAQHLNLTNINAQHGILFLQQLIATLTPKKTLLLPNYPNPFNPETWIPYQLAKPADVSITIYASDGSCVRKLDIGHQQTDLYQNRSQAAYWDGKNQFSEPVASGVYFYTLTAGNFTATRRMLILK